MRYKANAFVFVTHFVAFLIGVLIMAAFIGQICTALDIEDEMASEIAQSRCNNMSAIPVELWPYCYPDIYPKENTDQQDKAFESTN